MPLTLEFTLNANVVRFMFNNFWIIKWKL